MAFDLAGLFAALPGCGVVPDLVVVGIIILDIDNFRFGGPARQADPVLPGAADDHALTVVALKTDQRDAGLVDRDLFVVYPRFDVNHSTGCGSIDRVLNGPVIGYDDTGIIKDLFQGSHPVVIARKHIRAGRTTTGCGAIQPDGKREESIRYEAELPGRRQ